MRSNYENARELKPFHPNPEQVKRLRVLYSELCGIARLKEEDGLPFVQVSAMAAKAFEPFARDPLRMQAAAKGEFARLRCMSVNGWVREAAHELLVMFVGVGEH